MNEKKPSERLYAVPPEMVPLHARILDEHHATLTEHARVIAGMASYGSDDRLSLIRSIVDAKFQAGQAREALTAEQRAHEETKASRDTWQARYESLDGHGYKVARERDEAKKTIAQLHRDLANEKASHVETQNRAMGRAERITALLTAESERTKERDEARKQLEASLATSDELLRQRDNAREAHAADLDRLRAELDSERDVIAKLHRVLRAQSSDGLREATSRWLDQCIPGGKDDEGSADLCHVYADLTAILAAHPAPSAVSAALSGEESGPPHCAKCGEPHGVVCPYPPPTPSPTAEALAERVDARLKEARDGYKLQYNWTAAYQHARSIVAEELAALTESGGK